MRIYCLSSITLCEETSEIFIPPTDYIDEANENIVNRLKEEEMLRKIKNNTEYCDYYNLTEICIGFKEDEKKKFYVMEIYRDDIGLIRIPMVVGYVLLPEM